MEGLSIRKATADDLKKVVEIESRSQSAPWNFASFEAELIKPFSTFLVVTDDETDELVSGYVVFSLVDHRAEIETLAVHPQQRGRGIGRALICEVVKEAIRGNAKTVFLEVRKSNIAAISLYQKCRFAIFRIYKRFYSDGEDAYLMELDLSDSVKLAQF